MNFSWSSIKKNPRNPDELIDSFCKRLYLFNFTPTQKAKAHTVKYNIVGDIEISEKHKKDLLNCLIKAGIKLDHIPDDKAGESLLSVATALNNTTPNFIQYLLDNMEYNHCQTSKNKENPLLNILKSKNPNTLEITRMILNKCGDSIVKQQDKFLNTPLHVASQSNYKDSPEVIELLFAFGALDSLEKRDMYGKFPLIRAFESDNPRKNEVISILINKGANTDIKYKNQTPLILAAIEGNEQIVKKLFENPKTAKTIEFKDDNDKTALLTNAASKNPNMNIIRFLVDKQGANIETTDQFGNNALFYAIENGSLPLIKYLLTAQRRKLNVGHKNNDGETALMKAVQKNRVDIVKLLLSSGADINAVNNDGDSVLMYAIESDNPDLIRYLITQNKIDIKHSNNLGRTVLHIAVTRDSKNIVSIIKVILDNIDKDKEFINKQDFLGNTVLHYTMQQPNRQHMLQILQYLINKGAKRSIKNNDQKSARYLAGVKGIKLDDITKQK